MLATLLSIVGVIITLLFVVGTHEAAHFITARALGVKVLRFSIGFGKKLFSFHDRSGTEYVFALIPLGGYVKMLDEGEGTVAKDELHLAYNRQPFYKKFLIVLAGPACNLVCALILYWLIFLIGFVTIKPVIDNVTPKSIAAQAGITSAMQEITQIDHHATHNWVGALFRILAHAGNHDTLTLETKELSSQKTHTYVLDLENWHLNELTPDPLTSLGINPYEPIVPLVIGIIEKNSPAAQSSLRVGDRLMTVNQMPIKSWDELIKQVVNHPGETIPVTVMRQGKHYSLSVSVGVKRNIIGQKSGFLGIGPAFKMPKELLTTMKFGPLTAAGYAFTEVNDFTYFNLVLFGKLFTGKLSLQSLGGPITIFETAGEALNVGLIAFLAFLAFLSLSIGLINLLPIPGLDGGHLFFQFVEWVIRRPVPERILLVLYRLGFIFLILILVRALVNDVLRLF